MALESSLQGGQKAADTCLFAGSRQTALDDLRFQKSPLIDLYVLIVFRQPGLALLVHHKEKLDHFPRWPVSFQRELKVTARAVCTYSLEEKGTTEIKIMFLKDSPYVCSTEEPE